MRYVFRIVVWSGFRMGQSKDDDHRESTTTENQRSPGIDPTLVYNRKGKFKQERVYLNHSLAAQESWTRICWIDYVVDRNTKIKYYLNEKIINSNKPV